MKTNELTGPALDWAVAQCEFPDANTKDIEVWVQPLPCDDLEDFKFQPSTDWAQGGPIIERERISTQTTEDYWDADLTTESGAFIQSVGDTPLIAAMRCYVASQLGDEIDVPEELNA